MVIGAVRYLATKANVLHVKARVETYVSNRSFGFADFPQSRFLPRLAFIIAADDFPVRNELHLQWWHEIVSSKPFVSIGYTMPSQEPGSSDPKSYARQPFG